MNISGHIKENKSDWFYQLPNGSQIWVGGLDDKERTEKILGNEYSTIYFNEASQISYESIITAYTRLAENSGLVNKVYFDCNPPTPQHWLYKLFIDNVDPVTNLSIDASLYASMLMNPVHNEVNLPDGYIKETLDNLPERQRKRFLLGEWVADVEGALWNMSLIDRNRVESHPDLLQIVVAIDPAVTANPDSDETGIVIGGKGIDNVCYIFDDVSGIYTPRQWAERSIFNYEKYKADKIVAEKNNGGDLVKVNLQTIDKNIEPVLVHASRGKVIRAEPVVGLYEQGRVKHVKYLHKLEEQMTTWSAKEGEPSPDRVDALVWLVTYLMGLDPNTGESNYSFL